MAMHQAIAQLTQRLAVLLLEGFLQSFPELTLTDTGRNKDSRHKISSASGPTKAGWTRTEPPTGSAEPRDTGLP